MKRSAAAILVVLASACAAPAPEPGPAPAPSAAPAPAPALNPVGRYEFSTLVDGAAAHGTMVVEGQPGAYTGYVEANVLPRSTITAVTVSGQRMVLTVSAPQGPLMITLNVDGSAVTGNWVLGESTGEITGRRVS